ncbi:MAG: hypothetical protein IGS03_16720 [Candidatus Sericytochromatia bacterium]|nr:hypothetical protein [Candidatus Sericytochromatia bacterium]
MISLEFQHIAWLIGLLIAWTGLLVGLIRALFKQLVVNLEKGIEDDRKNWHRIDQEFKQLLVRLPLDYQRREDSIREYTALNMKMDRIYEHVRKP